MITRVMMLLAFLSLSLGIAFAQDAKTAQGGNKDDSKITRTKVMKVVQGEISSLTKRSISIVYYRDEVNAEESEILIPFDRRKVQLGHIRDLSELAAGDIVSVQFEEEDVTGQGKDKTNFQAKLISFVRKGTPKKVATESQAVPGLEVLDSNANNE